MAGTVENPTQQTETPPPEVVVPDDASRLCVTCAALLAEGQDWCLECGTAQPGRIGDRPGRRAALTVLAAVAVLALGAAAAAYAALSSDPEPRTVAQAPPPAAVPAAPPAPAPATPAPADETPSVPAPTDDAGDGKAPAGGSGAGDDATAGSSGDTGSGTGSGTSGGSSSSGSGSGTSAGTDTGTGAGTATGTEDEATEQDKPVSRVIALAPDAASTFDPQNRAAGLTGDPAEAIDGRAKTAWEAPVGTDGKVNVGLLISLEKAQAIDKVRLQTGTPGFSVELYATKLGTAPDNSPGATKYWSKLDTTRDFGTDEKLSAGGEKYRHVLLWFTDQPADTKVVVPEVALLKPAA
ncbi:MAG TPA: hypothetical protein VGW75_15565 [Solirubrobacteraceae bacterium]|nr:hypothetical protein [Solirubrobacteraceae bacterium]